MGNERGRLLLGRLAEQGSVALIGVLVARDSTPDEYFPFAVLLLVTSASAIIASLGLNLDVLSRRSVRFRSRDARALFLSSVTVTIIAAAGTVMINPVVSMSAAAVWIGNGYAQIGKAALIRDERVNLHLRAEAASLAVMWPVFVVFSDSAVIAGSIAIAVLAVVQAVLTYRPARVFGGSAAARGLPILSTQAAAVFAGNADYAVASALLPSGLFSVYVLAFRLANAVSSQVLSAIIRLYMRDFDADGSLGDRQRLFDRTTLQAGLLGVVGGLAIVPVLITVRLIIGPDWDPMVGVGIALVLGIPCRAMTVVVGTSLLVSMHERRLTLLELVRAALFALAAVAGASIGVQALAASVTVGAALNCWIFQRFVCRDLGLEPSGALRIAPPATIAAAACLLMIG